MLKELDLRGAKIAKIFGKDRKNITLQLHKSGGEKSFIRIKAPNFVYASSEKESESSEFLLLLRKRVQGKRIEEVKQEGLERIFELRLGEYSLLVELFGKGNILLLQEGKILVASEYKRWKDRTVKPKEEYVVPPARKSIMGLSFKEFFDVVLGSDKEIVKILASDLGLGGVYAEELCFLANVDKKTRELSEKDAKLIHSAFNSLLSKRLDPRVYFKEKELIAVTPFPISIYNDYDSKEFKTFSEALDYSSLSFVEEKVNPKIARVEKIISQQEESIRELTVKADELQKKGEFIYENYQKISEIVKGLRKARETHSWKEIKQKVKPSSVIKEIDEKEKSVVVEL